MLSVDDPRDDGVARPDNTVPKIGDDGTTVIVSRNDKELFNIKAMMAVHKDTLSEYPCLGFIINVDEVAFAKPDSIIRGGVSIVYTGDTAWNNTIYEKYKEESEIIKEERNNKLVLIANIGGFGPDELKDKENHKLYPNHLGFVGLVELNHKIKPDVCLITEWGEEFRGNRVELTKLIRRVVESEKVYAAEMGFTLEIASELKIQAIDSVDPSKKEIKKKYFSIEDKNGNGATAIEEVELSTRNNEIIYY